MPSKFDTRLDQNQAEIGSLTLHVNDLLERLRVLEQKHENLNLWMSNKMVEAIDEIVKKELLPDVDKKVLQYTRNHLHDAIIYQLVRWDEWKPRYRRIGRFSFSWNWEKKREAQ